MISTHSSSKDYGLLSLSRSQLVIDFKPFEVSDRIIGVETGIPLDRGITVNWSVGDLKTGLTVLSSRAIKSGVYHTKLALQNNDFCIADLLKKASADDKGPAKSSAKALQAVRFPLNESCLVSINTFGSKDRYSFELVNISRSGALVESHLCQSNKAPFLDNTLIEIHFDPIRSPLFSFTGAPHYLVAKVVRRRIFKEKNQSFQQFGLKVITSEGGEDPSWTRLVNRMEEAHLSTSH